MIEKSHVLATVGRVFPLTQMNKIFTGNIDGVANIWLEKAVLEGGALDQENIRSCCLSYNPDTEQTESLNVVVGCFETLLSIDGFSLRDFISSALDEIEGLENSSIELFAHNYRFYIQPEPNGICVRVDCVQE